MNGQGLGGLGLAGAAIDSRVAGFGIPGAPIALLGGLFSGGLPLGGGGDAVGDVGQGGLPIGGQV